MREFGVKNMYCSGGFYSAAVSCLHYQFTPPCHVHAGTILLEAGSKSGHLLME